MKKLLFCILALICGTIYVQAQSSKDIYNERKEIRKSTKKELEEKATKTARKEAKRLEDSTRCLATGKADGQIVPDANGI